MTEESRHLHLRGATGTVRKEMYQGREHLVVPVIALMDGVIHAVNASTPERVTTATLTKAALSWNGRPLVLGHPTKNGRQCSANEPSIEASHHFGTIFNSRMSGSRLLMDAYVDPKRAELVANGLGLDGASFIRDIRDGKPIEVSVGAYVQTKPEEGVHNGKAFKATWLETHGDHLAFLPGGRGACSIEMGCGAHRAASEAEEPQTYLVTAEGFEALGGPGSGNFGHSGRPGQVGGSGDSGGGGTFKEGDRVTIGDTHWDQRLRGQQGTVKSSATSADGKPTHYVKTDGGRGQFIHADELTSDNANENDELEDLINSAPITEIGGVKLPIGRSSAFKATDTVAPGTKVTFHTPNADEDANEAYRIVEDNGDRVIIETVKPMSKGSRFHPQSVVLKADLKRLAAKDCSVCESTGQITNEKQQEDCPSCDGSGYIKTAEVNDGSAVNQEITQMKKVDAIKALTSCPCTGFVAADAKELEAFSEERLTAMAEVAATRKTEQDKLAADLKAAQDTAAELKAASEKTPSEEEFLAKAPESIRTLVAEKKAQDAQQKSDLVAQLKTAAAGVYTEEELNAMSIDQLVKTAQLAKVEAPDFSGRALPQVRNAADASMYTPPDPWAASIAARK